MQWQTSNPFSAQKETNPFCVRAATVEQTKTTNITPCYTQALGVVIVRSLSIELSGRIKVRNGCPFCRASQGQNLGIR